MTLTQRAGNVGTGLLFQVLQDVEHGRYLDWDDAAQAAPSLVQALYDAGWSGVSVRPAAAPIAARPLDWVLSSAAVEGGAAAAQGELHLLNLATARAAGALRALNFPVLQPWLAVLQAGSEEAEGMLEAAGYRCIARDRRHGAYASPLHPGLTAAPLPTREHSLTRQGPRPVPAPIRLEAALAAAEARLESSQRRAVDAVVATGHARHSIRLMHQESDWLRNVADRAMEGEANLRAEVAWLRGVTDHAKAAEANLLAEIVWLRGCLADSRAETGAAHAAAAQLQTAVAALEGRQGGVAGRFLRRAARPLSAFHRVTPKPVTPAEPLAAPKAEGKAAPPPQAIEPSGPPRPASPEPAGPPPVPSLAQPQADAGQPAAAGRAGVRTAVHQFHAGSAQGDAITNAMLLIRKTLRSAGFSSDIFVRTRGEGLGEDILLMDALPVHDGYVLLLHHSMGLEEIGPISALPAPKILVYHNITPPELLTHLPKIQRLATIGRQQLGTLRSQVVMALADSDYSAIELLRQGYDAVRTCPLLFDTAAMACRATAPRLGGGPFTVLFVGRVTPSKGQADLVDAFALFSRRFGRPCRLVLVGALDPDEFGYIEDIRSRAAAAGLDGAVELTGAVPDRERDDWYRRAGLYVSLSLHEGFGVPLVEAMAHGVPVVALAAGAVPYTLGQAGTLLPTRDPLAAADAMLAAARNAAHEEMKGPPEVQRFDLAQHLPVLFGALAMAGAPLPAEPAERAAVAANLRVAIAGHVNGTYSLATVNRTLARTLEAWRPGAVRVLPVEGDRTSYLDGVPDGERAGIARLAGRAPPLTGPELVVSGHYPLYVPAGRGDLLAALFFWEESLIPPATVRTLNAHFDVVFAASRFVAKVLVDSGVGVPVVNLGHAPELAPFFALPPRSGRRERFTFLHVSSAFPRKGVDALLAAWAQAFTARDPVRLVIKCFPNPHNDVAVQLERLRAARPGLAPVELIDRDVPAPELLALYQDSDAAVLPTRGEGYNLPAAEAMAAGLPLIVTAHGGHLDFCGPATARLVGRHFALSGSHLASPHSLWAEPDVADLAAAMQAAEAGTPDGQVGRARRAIAAAADPGAMAARMADAAAALLAAPPRPPVRTAWITSWAVRCGVAEYSRALLGALPRAGLAEPVVLADDRTPPERSVCPAWSVGAGDGIGRLLGHLAGADPDVVVIQHQPGLLPWAVLGDLAHSAAAAGRAAVVTLHNTRHLLDIDAAERAGVVDGLRRVARILVHTLADIAVLDGLGLAGLATLLPHAAPPGRAAAIRALPADAAPLVGCTGFFLPGKGIPALIAAAAMLRADWPGARLRLVNAEYDDPASAAEIAACRRLAAQSGIDAEWHTDFLPLEEQQALLRECDVLVLPYEPSKESSSAALRSAMTSGVPVAVTPIALFGEAADAVFRLPGHLPADIAGGLAALLADAGRREGVAEAARAWLGARSLDAIATRLHGMLCGLAAQRRLGAPLDGSIWPVPPR